MRFAVVFTLVFPCALFAQQDRWVATWATSQQLYGTRAAAAAPATPPPAPAPAPPPGTPGRRFPIPEPLTSLDGQTVRMIARISMGGSNVRIRLDNSLGLGTVQIGAAHIALRAEGSTIQPGTDRTLTFSGKSAAIMYAGETLISDPVSLNLPPLSHVAVSLFIPGQTGAPTNHRFALHTTYISPKGDFSGQASLSDATTRESWYWLAGIDVLAPPDAGTLVTFGDSITDGDQSTPETDGMWPAILAARLQANKATSSIAVVNAGISGNRLLGDNSSALARLYHDVLSQPGIRWVSVLEGINDITGGSRNGAMTITADQIISAYRQIIENAHLFGVKVIGCTLTPYGGSNVYNDYGESVRTAVNQWIRTGGGFDAVVDFDAAIRDPKDPKRFRPEADSPDMLHPANPGYKLMGDAFDLSIFTAAKQKTKR
jgi:lysophospholipase L1-like esterase